MTEAIDEVEIFEHRGLVCTIEQPARHKGEWWQGRVHLGEGCTLNTAKWHFRSEAIQDTKLLADQWHAEGRCK